MFKRDKDDHRSAREVIDDVSHDLYHRAVKLDKTSRDRGKHWTHDDDCEWKRANER